MVARSVQFNQPIINNHPMTLKYEKSLGDKELYKHLLERCQLKHRPATAAKYAKASAHFKRMMGRLSEALASPGADNLVQRLTERIMNPRVGGGPQAIKVLKIHNIYCYIDLLCTFLCPGLFHFTRILMLQVILAHLPLTLVCLDGLGNLSEKHPVMAQQAVSCLRFPRSSETK